MFPEEGKVAEVPQSATIECADDTNSFSNLPFPIRHLPALDPARVKSFEEAREVFLRAAGRIELAKREFPMEGIYPH